MLFQFLLRYKKGMGCIFHMYGLTYLIFSPQCKKKLSFEDGSNNISSEKVWHFFFRREKKTFLIAFPCGKLSLTVHVPHAEGGHYMQVWVPAESISLHVHVITNIRMAQRQK